MQPLRQIRSAAESLASQAVRLYRFRAVLWSIVCGVLVTAAFVLIDYALHVDELGLRWLLSLMWLCSLVAIGWYWLGDAWRFRLTSLHVAQWLERGRPELSGRLSNLLAADQLPENDPRFGSLQLRQALLASDSAQLSDLGWSNLLDKRATIRAGSLFALAILGVLLLAVVNQSLLALGLQRIAAPWRVAPWPRADQLEFVNLPEMIPINSELEVQVNDQQPPLPLDVRLELRQRSDQSDQAETISLPMRAMESTAVVTLPGLDRDFELRVLGGDQRDSAWRPVRVARRPVLVEHQFTIQPPSYTGQGAIQLVGQRIEVLAGSRVTFHGQFDVPIRAIEVIELATSSTKDQPDQPAAPLLPWIATLTSDGCGFDLAPQGSPASVIEQDQMWSLEITTQEGLVVRDQRSWHLRVTADQAPSVTLGALDWSSMTRQGHISVHGQAVDDLGLVEVALQWRLADTKQPTRKIIWSARPTEGDASPSSPAESSAAQPQKVVEVVTQWPQENDALLSGQRVSIELEAVDSAGQRATSLAQTLEILDDQQMLAQLQSKQTEVFGSLREMAQSHQRATHSLERTLEVVKAAGKVDESISDALSTAGQLENSVADALSRSPDSVRAELESLGRLLEQNKLSDSQLAQEAAQLKQRIEQLVKGSMEPAISSLEQANQVARQSAEQAGNPAQSTEAIEKALQDARQVASQFNQLTDSIESVESLADMQKQFQQLLNQQMALRETTQQLQVQSLTENSRSQLESQQAGVRSDQQELARHVNELLAKVDREIESADQPGVSPDSATANVDVLGRVRQQLLDQEVGQRMQQAAEQINDRQLSQALQSQQSTIEALEHIVGEFNASGLGGLQGSSSAMENLARQLNQLADRQSALAEQFQAQSASTNQEQGDALAQEQARLSQAIEQAASRAAASQAMRDTLEQAAAAAQAAAQSAQQDQFQAASGQAATASSQLRAAQQQADQKADQLKAQLSQQQLLDLATLLGALVKRQAGVVEQLNAIAEDAQGYTPAELAELIQPQQQSLGQLREGRGQLKVPTAFDWLLQQCDDELVRSVAALERQRVHPEASTSASAALDMFRAALAALENNQTEAASDNADPSADASEQSSNADQPRPGVALTSLKLLREMQTLLNEQATRAMEVSPADTATLQRLSQRQEALAEQVEALIKQPGNANQ